LKRAFLQKVRSTASTHSSVLPEAESVEPTSPGARRKHRTSAAMLGLALSMGTSGLMVPRQDERATAAEPTAPDLQISETSQSASKRDSFEHVVREGETLLSLSRQYQVAVEAIASANGLKAASMLAVGQVVNIPGTALQATTTPNDSIPEKIQNQSGTLIASSQLQRSQIANAPTAVDTAVDAATVQRNEALARLRQERSRLMDRLANLPESESESTRLTAVPEPVADVQASAESDVSNVSETSTAAKESTWLRPVHPRETTAQATPVQPTEAAPSVTLPTRNADGRPVTAPVAPSVAPVVSAPRVAAAGLNQFSTYRVNLGDTVASIARAHNVTPSLLVSTNRLIDPNVIFVGQTLRIPEAPSVGGADSPVALSRAFRESRASEASRAPSFQPTTPRSTNVSAGGNSGENPYVQNLLSEVRALREQRSSRSQAEAQPAAAPVRIARVNNPPIPSSDSVRIRVTEARVESSRSNAQVIAAAPAGSESYSPLLRPSNGTVVSPDVPPLPGGDNYLPEGSTSNGYLWPARGVLTSGYGWRWGRMHAGIDIAADVGTPIYSAADGVVEYADWNSGGYGNLVEIRHPDGSLTRYAHLDSIGVRQGERVKQGQQIAEMGSTGYSTGPHLHFEVHLANQGSVNPMAYLPGQ
jgi:murein DD-endopeptidase MepM/ murein hydrolase activator NlpD